jgi:hypothetical protein
MDRKFIGISDRNPIGSDQFPTRNPIGNFLDFSDLNFFVEEVKRNHFKGTFEISCPFPVGFRSEWLLGYMTQRVAAADTN